MEVIQQILGQVLDLLRSYAQLWARAVGAISDEFGLGLAPEIANLVGIVLGFIILFAFIRRLTKWDPKGNTPQAFPLKTTETPNEVVAKDREKFLMMLLRVTLFVLFIVVVITSR